MTKPSSEVEEAAENFSIMVFRGSKTTEINYVKKEAFLAGVAYRDANPPRVEDFTSNKEEWDKLPREEKLGKNLDYWMKKCGEAQVADINNRKALAEAQEEIKEATANKKEVHSWNEKQAETIRSLDIELAASRAEVAKLREALEGILNNVSLDWYVQNFSKQTQPHESGIIAEVHNRDTLERIKVCFERAREALQEPSAEAGK